jgi:pyrroloquinoline-quinone synthase
MSEIPEHAAPWPPAEFERRLRERERYYHSHHPFQVMMNAGELDRRQMQGWVANRYYYQIIIPRKDASLLARCPDPTVRRLWVRRIVDHDGGEGGTGGIEAWLRLGEACGLVREEMLDERHVLPGVRFAVDAYLNFVREAPWQEGVCSSLTELFAPTLHRERLSSWPERYPWLEPSGLEYFRTRIGQAHADVRHGLELTLAHFRSRREQERALAILQFKLDVLWTMLDAMHLAYVLGRPPYHGIAGAS